MIARWTVALCLTIAAPAAAVAPGAPGEKATWTNGNKQAVGTSTSLQSKVWFTLGDGALTEVYYPTVDKAATRLLELVVVGADGLVERETTGMTSRVEKVDGRALAFRQVNQGRSGRYRLVKTVFADPARSSVMVHLRLEPTGQGPLRLFVSFDPALANSGLHDTGYDQAGALLSEDAAHAAALVSSSGFRSLNSGYVGRSDGLAELLAGKPLPSWRRAADGNVGQLAEIVLGTGSEATLVIGFGTEGDQALATARASLAQPWSDTLAAYVRGWNDYVATLRPVREEFRDAYTTSAMLLKAHEDKTYRGAMIASLTAPWGHEADASEASVGGYHLVWSRDLYQVATAFHAMGDKGSADRALHYLLTVQQRPDGSLPQNTWLDGRPYWPSLQLDEVAFPLVLAWSLGRSDGSTWERHLKPAAEFLIKNGPRTPQERWEEEGGYSPSTIAAEIAGLIAAAAIAEQNQDKATAARYRQTADDWATRLASWTVTRTGPHSKKPHYLRLSQDGKPDSGRPLEINNGGGTYDEREIVDAGFLELVRLGIVPADDPLIVESLRVVDAVIRVETPVGPGFYRYNRDGYGEKADGRGYDGTGVGRLWPLLTGERGEYELMAGRDPKPWLRTLIAFAGESLMPPEQVWDRSDSPAPHLRFGRGTGSATPLAWACAQIVRLALAVEDGRVVETPAVVRDHFARARVTAPR